jgi:hypothetical protein
MAKIMDGVIRTQYVTYMYVLYTHTYIHIYIKHIHRPHKRIHQHQFDAAFFSNTLATH